VEINNYLKSINLQQKYLTNNQVQSNGQVQTNNQVQSNEAVKDISNTIKPATSAENIDNISSFGKMRAQLLNVQTNYLNIQEGNSLVQSADISLEQTESIVTKMKSITKLATNSAINSSDRSTIDKALKTLTNQVDKLTTSANFNGVKLFDGSLNRTYSIGTDNIDLKLNEIDSSSLKLNTIDITTPEAAKASDATIDNALSKLTEDRDSLAEKSAAFKNSYNNIGEVAIPSEQTLNYNLNINAVKQIVSSSKTNMVAYLNNTPAMQAVAVSSQAAIQLLG